MEDSELLRDYLEHGCDQAFTALVNRHLPLVYSAALRQLRTPDQAQDVAQSVFTLLARKAHQIRNDRSLVGWLHKTATFQAARLRRADDRRKKRELAATIMNLNDPIDQSKWENLLPHLDAAIQELAEKDREIILLRFFSNQSLRALGARFSTSEDAARMRVNRALDRLRSVVSSKGLAFTSLALGQLLLTHAVETVPDAVSKTVLKAALDAAKVSRISIVGSSALFRGVAALVLAFAILTLGLVQFDYSKPDSITDSILPHDRTSGNTAGLQRSQPGTRSAPLDPSVEANLATFRKILYSPIKEATYPSPELMTLLKELEPRLTVPILLEVLASKESMRVWQYLPVIRAISSLGHLGKNAEEAFPILLNYVKTRGAPYRDAALFYALPRLRSEPGLAQDLMELYRSDAVIPVPSGYGTGVLRDYAMRDWISQGIGTLVANLSKESAAEVGALIVPYLRDSDPDIRLLAASALSFTPKIEAPAAVDELSATLRETNSKRDPLAAGTALLALARYGAVARAAESSLREFLEKTGSQDERRLAEVAIRSINSGNPATDRPEGDIHKTFSPRSIEDLGVALNDVDRRVDAARALEDLGPKAREALPQLYTALAVEDDVFRQLLVAAIKKIAPGEPKPLLSKDEVAGAFRDIIEITGSADAKKHQSVIEMSNGLVNKYYTHADLNALLQKLGSTDLISREVFLRKLEEIDPPLGFLLRTQSQTSNHSH